VNDIAEFNKAIIEATADLVCAYKPNLAFFEAQGIEGLRALENTLAAIPSHIPVIGDAKRGDIGHTAAMYARSLFDVWGFDACTVNPWGGMDSLDPFIDRADKGIFVWCRSSNPGAADLQDLMVSSGETAVLSPLFLVLARLIRSWDRNKNLALVVGATFPQQLQQVRSLCPDMTILLPGIGAQGGEVAATMQAGLDRNSKGVVVATSRQVLYASAGPDFAEAARRAASSLRDEINSHRRAGK
jgi:orotidine-5'-phosphate decarboxylase